MENKLNKLLQRQIKRHFGSVENMPDSLAGLLSDINNTYESFDDDLKLLQNSIEISSQELRNAFQKHKDDAENQKKTINKIKEAIFAIKPASVNELDKNGMSNNDSSNLFESLIKLIEESKHSEKEIRKLSTAVEQNPASIVITNIEGNIENGNSKFCDVSGYTKEDVIGKNPRILKTENSSPEMYKNIWQTILQGKEWKGEFLNKKKNGELYWELASISSVKNNNGEIVNFLAIKEDITARKQTEETLENERALFRTIIDLIPDAVYVKDKKGRKILSNPKDVYYTGKESEDEIIGKTDADLYTSLQAQQSYDEDLFVVETVKSIINKEESAIDKEGQKPSLLVSKVPLYDVQGKITGLVGVTHDITDRKKAADALEAAHKSLSDILNAAIHTTIISTDTDGIITVFSKGAEKMLGYSADELIGKKSPNCFHLESEISQRSIELSHELNRTIEGFEVFVAKARIQEHEERTWTYIRKDGSSIYVNLIVTAIRDNNKEVIGFLGIASDITDRIEAEKALLQSSKKWEAIISASPDGIGMVSFDGKLEFISDKLVGIYGFSTDKKEEYMGKTIFDFIDPSNHKILNENITNLINKGIDNKISEYLAIKKDNSQFYVDINSTVLHDENGKFSNILFVQRDITERKQAEEKIKQVSTRLALATYAGGVGVWDYDIPNNILLWDDQMFKLYGIENRDTDMEYNTWLACIHPEDAERANLEIKMAISGKKDFDTELRVNWPDGSTHNIRALATVQHDKKGEAVRMIGTNWDITEQKETEAVLLNARKEAEMANKAKSEFLANVSHEIRTPMNAIIGFAEILMDKTSDIKLKQHIKTILSSGRTLLSLINDILDLSKIEAGKLDVEFEAMNYVSIIQDIEQLFLPKVEAKNLSLEIINHANLPEYIYMDEVRFHQILFNLVGNAIKFTQKGFIRIETKIKQCKEKNKVDLIIEIEDTGIGIPENQQKIIFDAFTQQSGQSNRQFEGTGLGLAITKRLIEKMNGTISVESRVGRGSVFTVHFNDIEIANIKTKPEQQVNSNEREIFFSPATIMVVDDIDFNIQIVQHMLDFANFKFITANNAEMALELLQFEKPDIIFMDIRMHGMSGISATEIIKKTESTNKIPVIAFTASALHNEMEKIKQLFDGYLGKPVSKKTLIQTLKEHLKYTFGDEISTLKEANIFDIEINDSCSKVIPELLLIIDHEILDQWKEISGNLIIFEIEEFCNKLLKLSGEFKCNILKKYALQLNESIQTFDVELIEKNVKEFEDIVKLMKKHIK